MILGLGLSAIQILPTVELLKNSGVSTQTSGFIIDKFLVPLKHLITILIPNYFGNPGTYNYFGGPDYAQTVAYIGLITCFFVYLSLTKLGKRINLTLFYFVSCIITILFAINWIGAKLILSLPIPLLSTGAPSRIFFLTTFSLVILAGLGFDQWLSLDKKDLKKFIFKSLPFFMLVLGIILLTGFLYFIKAPCEDNLIQACRTVSLRNTLLEMSVFLVSLFPLFLYLFLKKTSKIKGFLPFAIIALIIVIGYYNSTKYIPFTPKSSFFPPSNLTTFLRKSSNYSRVFGIGHANIPTDFATYLKFYDPNYYHPLFIERYRELVNYANTGKFGQELARGDIEIDNQASPSAHLNWNRKRLLNLLGVKYLIFDKNEVPINFSAKNIVWQDSNFYLIRNTESLPKIYFVNSFEDITQPEKIVNKLFNNSFDYKNDVILEKKPKNFVSNSNSSNAKITYLKYSENNIVINATSEKNSLLVLSDNFYPGWNAYIDGEKTVVYRANYTFRAVVVPAGQHAILFIYQPASFNYGLIISALSLLGILWFYLLAEYHILKPHSK